VNAPQRVALADALDHAIADAVAAWIAGNHYAAECHAHRAWRLNHILKETTV
jgi:hypothetical protein